jgi:hypothetical protein
MVSLTAAKVTDERKAQLTAQSSMLPGGLAIYFTGNPASILPVLPVMFIDTVEAGLPMDPKFALNDPVV